MSSVLVKKSLELFKEDFDDIQGQQKKKKKVDPMKQISTRKKGVKKELKKLKKQREMEQQLKMKKKLLKTAVDDVRNQKSQDMTEENLAYFAAVSHLTSVNKNPVNNILQHGKKLAKDNYKPEPKQRKQQSILFSDNAFDIEDQNEEEEEFWNVK